MENKLDTTAQGKIIPDLFDRIKAAADKYISENDNYSEYPDIAYTFIQASSNAGLSAFAGGAFHLNDGTLAITGGSSGISYQNIILLAQIVANILNSATSQQQELLFEIFVNALSSELSNAKLVLETCRVTPQKKGS